MPGLHVTTPRWVYLCPVDPYVTTPGSSSSAGIYARKDERIYAESWLFGVGEDGPRLHIWAFRGTDAEVRTPSWISNRFQQVVRYSVAVPVDILADILQRHRGYPDENAT